MKMYTIHFSIYEDLNEDYLLRVMKLGWWAESSVIAEMDFIDCFKPMFDWIESNCYSFDIYVEVPA